MIGLRWYLARAKAGYLREGASYSRINATLTETVEGARTVEALGLGDERIAAIDDDIRESYAAEKYTLYLRTVFFPSMELSYLIPTVSTLLLGGYLYMQGTVSLGDVTAATLYVQMLIDPVDRIVSILDELQLGAASLARLLGVAEVPDDREVTGHQPEARSWSRRDVRFSYVEGRDVLHGVDLDVAPGERIAMVGPSGAGKSTLGRLLAGIHPPRTGHGRPSVASAWSRWRCRCCADTSPWSPRSTTCSWAPCARTSRSRHLRARPTTTSARRWTRSTRSAGSSTCPTASTRSSVRAAAR